jgi:hypothetical protein
MPESKADPVKVLLRIQVGFGEHELRSYDKQKLSQHLVRQMGERCRVVLVTGPFLPSDDAACL